MAHYAEIINGSVARVIVAKDQEWCEKNLGGTWVQTSYTGSIRGKYAGIGDTYDSVKDEFIASTIQGEING
jgi:hypothetical protein